MVMIIIQYPMLSNPTLEAMATLNLQEPANSSVSLSRLRLGLGTFVAIEAEASCAEVAQAGVQSAFSAIARVERLMHPTRAGSDLERLHSAPTDAYVTVDEWTWGLLALCTRLNRLTHGIFDPCLPGFAGCIAQLELPSPQIVVRRADMHIDLGGIAKGFAVDRAIDALRVAGCHGGIVNAGGDVAAFGDRRYVIVARHARGETRLELHNMALATSVVGENARPKEHRGYYNGSNGREILEGSVSIMSRSAAVADALTKCVLGGDSAANAALMEIFDAKQIDE